MFSVQNLQLNRGTTTSNCQGNFTTVLHTYKDIQSTIAIIKSYFPPYLGQGAVQDFLQVGDHILILGSDTSNFCEILSLAPFTVSADLFSGASGLSILPPSVAVDQNGAVIFGDTFSLEIADTTHPGIITTGAQSFSGTKTFSENVTVSGVLNTEVIQPFVDADPIFIGGNDPINSFTFMNGFAFNDVGGITWPPSSNGASMQSFQTNIQQFLHFGGAFNTPRQVSFTVSAINNVVTLMVGELTGQNVDNFQPIYTPLSALPFYAFPVTIQNAPIIVINNGNQEFGNALIDGGFVYVYTGSAGGNFSGFSGFKPFSLTYSTLY